MSDSMKVVMQGVFVLIAAFLAARWAVSRMIQEKWWERKEQAYREIIESLYDLMHYSDLCADQHLTQGHANPTEELAQKYRQAHWRIEKATDIGGFVISDEATKVLQELRSRPKLRWDENPQWEFYEEQCKQYRNALDKIRDCARKHLGINRKWFWRLL